MLLNFASKSLADTDIVNAFLSNNEVMQRRAYKEFYTYFMSNYKGVLAFDSSAKTIEDLYQESFLKLWDEIQTHNIFIKEGSVYRRDKNGISRKMTANLKTYLMSVARYKNFEFIREEDLYSTADVGIIREDKADEEYEEDVRLLIINWCIEDLPPRCKNILCMFYLEGKSLDDILNTRKENISKDGLKTGKSKCLGSLKDKVRKELQRRSIRV